MTILLCNCWMLNSFQPEYYLDQNLTKHLFPSCNHDLNVDMNSMVLNEAFSTTHSSLHCVELSWDEEVQLEAVKLDNKNMSGRWKLPSLSTLVTQKEEKSEKK